jgi:hypothetical protein
MITTNYSSRNSAGTELRSSQKNLASRNPVMDFRECFPASAPPVIFPNTQPTKSIGLDRAKRRKPTEKP